MSALKLSWNNFGQKNCSELVCIFATIPITVTELDLTENELALHNCADLAKALRVIPSGVTSLNLSGNGLWNRSTGGLRLAFAAIRVTVTELNLSGNNLGKKSVTDLIEVFTGLSSRLTKITLSLADIVNRSPEEIAALGQALMGINEIEIVDDKGKPTDHHLASELRGYSGRWIAGAYEQLLARPMPSVLTEIIIEHATGATVARIKDITAHHGLFNSQSNTDHIVHESTEGKESKSSSLT